MQTLVIKLEGIEIRDTITLCWEEGGGEKKGMRKKRYAFQPRCKQRKIDKYLLRNINSEIWYKFHF